MSILKKKAPEAAPLIVVNLDRLRMTNTAAKKKVKASAKKSDKKQKKPNKIKQTINEVSIAVKVFKKALWVVKLLMKAVFKVFQTLFGRKKKESS